MLVKLGENGQIEKYIEHNQISKFNVLRLFELKVKKFTVYYLLFEIGRNLLLLTSSSAEILLKFSQRPEYLLME